MRAKRTMALGVLFLLSMASVAGRASSDGPAVENLTVNEEAEIVEFTVHSTEPVRYTYFELEGPRLIVDFHGAENRLGFWRRSVESGNVEQVRASFFDDSKREATRLVFDLSEATPYEVIDDGAGTVRVRFGAGVAANARVAPRGMDYSVLDGMDVASEPPSPLHAVSRTETLEDQSEFPTEKPTTISGKLAPGTTYWEDAVLKIATSESSDSAEVQPSLAPDTTTDPHSPEALLASADPDAGAEWKIEENTSALAAVLEDVAEDTLLVGSAIPTAVAPIDGPAAFEAESIKEPAPRVRTEDAIAAAHENREAELAIETAASKVGTPGPEAMTQTPVVEVAELVPASVPASPAEIEEPELAIAAVPQPVAEPLVVESEVASSLGLAAEAFRATEAVSPPRSVLSEIPTVEAPSLPSVAATPPVPFMGQAVQVPATPQYSGEIITLELVNVDLQQFFLLIADLSGLNVIVDEAVSGSVTLMLRDVPWDQALDLVLRNEGLGYELQGNILRIATQATLQGEEVARTALRTAQALNQELETRTFLLSYTQAATVSGVVGGVLTPRGNIIVDARRNALIISDVPTQFGQVDTLVAFLDAPAQQVEIEARLLSATKSFSRDLGSQIGLLIGNNGQNVITGNPGTASPFARTPNDGRRPQSSAHRKFPGRRHLGNFVPAWRRGRHPARRNHHGGRRPGDGEAVVTSPGSHPE